jgi:hypothetical protein
MEADKRVTNWDRKWRHCHAEKVSVYEWRGDDAPAEALESLCQIVAHEKLGFYQVTSVYWLNEDTNTYEWRVLAYLS